MGAFEISPDLQATAIAQGPLPCGTEKAQESSEVLPHFDIDCAQHFLLRVASLPFRNIESLALARTRTGIRRLLQLETKLSRQKAELEEPLFREVQLLFERRLGDKARRMLEVRRAIHNGRGFSSTTLSDDFLQSVSPSCAGMLRAHYASRELYESYKRRTAVCFENEISQKRAEVKVGIAGDGAVQKGLLLASRTLFQNLDDYARSPNESLRKRQRQTELSVVAYLFRMGVRTTPFGHFAAVAPGTWESTGPLKIEYAAPIERTVAKVSLRALQMITSELCRLPEIREHLHVRANRTLRSKGERLELIKRSGEKRSLVDAAESSVSVKRSPALDRVLQMVSVTPLKTRELVEALTRGSQDAGVQERARHYVSGLIDQQILEIEGIITEHAMNPLQDVLLFLERSQQIEINSEIPKGLREVETILTRFATASTQIREQCLVEIRSAFARVFEVLKLPPSRLEKNLLFEDSVLNSSPKPLNDSWFRQFESDLRQLATLRPLSDSKLSDQLNLAAVFKEKYGAGGICTDILEFWRSYLEATKAANSGKPTNTKTSMWPNESDPRVRAGERMARAYLEAARAGEREWSLDPDLVHEELRELWRYYPPCDFAHDLFCQLVRQDGTNRLVLNSVNPGWGKYFSRFCHLFDQEDNRNQLLDSMRGFVNRHCSAQSMLCDILGTFSHNANLRPSITEHELDYPGVESGRAPQCIVRLDEIELRHDPDFDAVRLYHKVSGQEILPLHLGFLSHMWVPAFYRFLTLFGPGWGGWPINMSFLNTTDAGLCCSASQPVVYFPRISLGRLVLRRGFWKVAADQMPAISEAKSDFESYLNLSRWWTNHSLPSECLVKPLWGTGQPESPLDAEAPEGESDPDQPDPAKPSATQVDARPVSKKKVWSYVLEGQYFNIANFFSVMLLVRTLRSSPNTILVEEIFSPRTSPIVTVNGESHMTELIVEMAYSRAAS